MSRFSTATSLAALSSETLQNERARRRAKVAGIERRHRALSRRLAAVEAQIRATGNDVGGAGPARRVAGRRARNEVSLAETLRQVLKGKSLGVAAIIAAVLNTGFKTHSKNFRTMVAIQLGKTKGLKWVSRGVYTAR